MIENQFGSFGLNLGAGGEDIRPFKISFSHLGEILFSTEPILRFCLFHFLSFKQLDSKLFI